MNWRLLFANPWRLAPAMMPASPVSARYKSPGSRDLNRLLTSGSSGSGPDDKETVEVQRRRRTEFHGASPASGCPEARTRRWRRQHPTSWRHGRHKWRLPPTERLGRVSPWPADGWRRS